MGLMEDAKYSIFQEGISDNKEIMDARHLNSSSRVYWPGSLVFASAMFAAGKGTGLLACGIMESTT